MVIIYYIFALFIYLISLPFLIFLSFKQKYKKSIPARFFLYKNPPFSKKLHWFHACSLGETKALKPIIKNFEEINLSVITQTGFDEAERHKNAHVRFLPYEIFLPFWIRSCKSLVVMEAELWYMLFYVAKRRCEKTILLNARISDRSFPKYMKFRWFYKKIFENIDIVLAQSETDKKRLLKLGAKNVKVIGNIKTITDFKVTKNYKKRRKLLVIASTHENEEEIILKNIPLEYQIVVAPRHPERFKEVEKFLKDFAAKNSLSFSKLSQSQSDEELKADIILDDVLGELINLYAVSDVVILGGSFVENVGGHNPIEVAYFNKPLISGRHIFNQKALYKEVENIKIVDVKELKEALKDLKPTFIKNRADLKEILRVIS
ncbi:lipid IV(A) 3-deoxy-D-manno-octulosonic acid transferase [Caminibacter pacificus]|jgi:3-deoxy-D-manno-octulosonic-acid transferase